jgi:hypothetical protein
MDMMLHILWIWDLEIEDIKSHEGESVGHSESIENVCI